MINKIVLLFFTSVILCSLVWVSIVPLWHFPDEQAHFGQVAFMAEKGRNPQGNELDLTEEIYTSELLLGTARDNLGNNKFTFHPEYKIEYTHYLVGKYEASIAALAKTEAKKKFVHQEVSRYPKLYYLPAALIYKMFYNQDLFTRVFAIRFWSLFLFIGTVYLSYKIGRLLFTEPKFCTFGKGKIRRDAESSNRSPGRSKFGTSNVPATFDCGVTPSRCSLELSITLAILVAFQPMMVFANVGVGSDSLGNSLFTLFLYLSLTLIIRGLKIRPLVFLVLTTIFCLYTKPQFIVTVPLLALVCLFIIWRDLPKKERFQIILAILIGIAILSYCLFRLGIGSFSLIGRFLDNLNLPSLFKFTWEYTLPHTYKEVLPWYWGIYDWLGVTYPRIVHRIINRTLLLAGIGFLIWIFTVVRNTSWKDKRTQGVVFLILTTVLYYLAISFYDWFSWYTGKYPLGVQGRYFFPVISSHMMIVLLGWQALFPKKWHLKEHGIKILGFLMVLLNFYGLNTVAKTYYDVLPVSTFVIQVSQYKPWFLKGSWLVALWFIYVMIMVTFLVEYIRGINERKN